MSRPGYVVVNYHSVLFRTLTGLAGWGATAGFGLFWMIGDESFAWAKSLVVGGEEEE